MSARRSLGSTLIAVVLFTGSLAKVHAFAGYREATLPNGLRVVLIEHHANPMIASSVIVGAGVVHEAAGRSGSSHLLEHLLFNGTTTRTQKQLYDEVDRYGAYNNATTREDHTLFSLLIQKEFVDKGLEIQADMLFRSTLPAANFEKEKGIVLEEMARDAGDPGYIAAQAFRSFAWRGTPLAEPVLGTRESISASEREAVAAYYRQRYRPENMILVLMGDFDSDAMLATVTRLFGVGQDKSSPASKSKDMISAWPAPSKTNLKTMPLDAPRLYVHAGFPLGLEAHAGIVPAVELLLEAVGSGDDAPLPRVLTAGSQAPAIDTAVGLTRRAGAWSTIEFEATVAKDKPPTAVLDAFVAALSDLGPGSTSRSRIDLVRARLRSSEILGADQIHYYAMTHADGLLGAPPGWLDRSARRFDGVNEADLAAAAKLLSEGARKARILIAGPGLTESESAWIPTAKALPEAKGSRAAMTLPSGARVFAQRNDDSQVFALHVALRPRAASEPLGKEGIASFLHRLFARGTAVTDAAALSARLDRLGANLKTDDDARVPFDDYYTTPEFSFLRLEMPADAWREGIALVGEVLRFPRLLPDDVEAVRAEMLDLQSRRGASSRNRAMDAEEARLAPGHPVTKPILGTASSLASITIDDLRSFHRAYVSGRRLIATVVAPIDADEVVEALGAAFAELPAGGEIAPIAPVPVTPKAAGMHPAEAPKDQATIVMGYVFDAPEEDRPALSVAGSMLSDELAFDLRETKGLAYSMGASIAPWGGRMRLLVTMGTRKENLDLAIQGLRDGIARFAPSDDAAVKRAAAATRGRMLMRRLTRMNQAYFAGLDLMDGRDPGNDAKKWDALLALDAAKVAAATRRYIDVTRLLVTVE